MAYGLRETLRFDGEYLLSQRMEVQYLGEPTEESVCPEVWFCDYTEDEAEEIRLDDIVQGYDMDNFVRHCHGCGEGHGKNAVVCNFCGWSLRVQDHTWK